MFAKKVTCEGGRWYAADYTLLPLTVKRSNCLARCRLSSHRLKVETGAWSRPAVPYEQRLCDLCDLGAVQNEHHIIFQCPRFHEEREVYLRAHLDNLEGSSIWYLFNEPGAQSAVADYLLSTGLMVH